MTTYTAQCRTVYFIRPVGSYTPIKVGCSDRPEKRRQSIAPQFGKPLEIVAQFAGSIDDEHRIQSLVWGHHRGGEWFDWCPELQTIIDDVQAGTFDIHSLPATERRPMPGRRKPWTEEQRQRASHAARVRLAAAA